MDVVRLTNLGNLTLRNYSRIDENYGENALAKRLQLAELWDSMEEMHAFESLFMEYQECPDSIIARDGNHFHSLGHNSGVLRNPARYRFIERFRELGLVEYISDTRDLGQIIEDVEIDEYANPAKYVTGVTVELTGLCNLGCRHCFRGGSRAGEYGLGVEALKQALAPMLRAGIKYLTFTGGEPTMRRDDLLELIGYAAKYLELKSVSSGERLEYEFGTRNPTIAGILLGERFVSLRGELMHQLSIPKDEILPGDYAISNENTPEDVKNMLILLAEQSLKYAKKPSRWNLDHISILTNGYLPDQRGFVRKLKQLGNVSIQTSLDSYDERTTDNNRGKAGVFASVRELVRICDDEGLHLDIQGHDLGGRQSESSRMNYDEIHQAVNAFDLPGMVQLGNAVIAGFDAHPVRSNNYIGCLSQANRHGDGWCKGFTRPNELRIRPTGIVGNCVYAYALPEEFGSLRSMSMAGIVNNIQSTRIYEMFRDGTIEHLQHELDKSIFSRAFRSSCEIVVLTAAYALAKERFMREGAPDPDRQANLQVARMYKFIK